MCHARKHRIYGKLGIQLVLEFVTLNLEINVDVILGTCSTIEIITCYRK